MSAQGIQQALQADFIRDVRAGLGKSGQKELPSSYLYDEVGAALFEAITLLPEYGLTRADGRLLELHSGELARRLPVSLVVAELGSGSGRKTRWILESLTGRRPLDYYPIDISRPALVKCRGELGRLAGVTLIEMEQSYLDGLDAVVAERKDGQTVLVLFLGSTIGNFDQGGAADFLRQVRARLEPGDALLLGTDLVKPVDQLLAAYNDATGVTAAFNLNVLARINRELGGEFALADFEHRAIYNHGKRRIEMHLRSKCRQQAKIRDVGLTVRLAEGETIWTESSHKFRLEDVSAMAHGSGFCSTIQWIDEEWPFAESLLMAS
jgi:dimethylhistidine N-methyltransferase